VDSHDHPAALWTPDGRSILTTSESGNTRGLDVVAIDGTQSRRIITSKDFNWPLTAWGDRLLFSPESRKRSSELEIRLTSLSGTGTSQPFVTTMSGTEFASSQFSPDGRWVAYASRETGRMEVFVAAFPQPGGRWQVSQDGGIEPRWNRNGRELLFVDLQNILVSVEVEASAAGFQSGASRPLFQFHGAGGPCRYDVAPDGDRFLVTVPVDEDLAAPVTLITDWTRKTTKQ
jgi:Tol biopolymer transport system component